MAEIRLDLIRSPLLPKLAIDAPQWAKDLVQAVQTIANVVYSDMNLLGVVEYSIVANDIANNAITANQIANNTITATQIVDNTLTTTQIANNTITANQIANQTITAAQIANATITAALIANNTITANQIANNTITAAQIANLVITANQIANNTITANQIANYAITATQVANLTITANQIANLTINANQIAANAIITSKVRDDNITRLWSYSSDTNVNIPEFGTTPEGIVIAYTEPFIPEVGPDLLISGYMEYLFSTMADPDVIRFLVHLYDAIDIVLAGSCKWTQFGATSEYYLTNMAGDGVPFGLTSDFCDRVFRAATSGGGIIMRKGTFGSLAEGEWVWSDGGGVLAFSTIFVRLFGNHDPDIYNDGQLRVGNLLQQFYSPFYTFYMDYAGDGMMVQTIEDEVTPTNTYKRSYILTCVEADCAGGLGSRVCYQDRVSFNVLERKK